METVLSCGISTTRETSKRAAKSRRGQKSESDCPTSKITLCTPRVFHHDNAPTRSRSASARCRAPANCDILARASLLGRHEFCIGGRWRRSLQTQARPRSIARRQPCLRTCTRAHCRGIFMLYLHDLRGDRALTPCVPLRDPSSCLSRPPARRLLKMATTAPVKTPGDFV